MIRDGPVEIARGGLLYGTGYRGHVRRDVVLEAVFADVAEEFLEVVDLDHARAAEGIQRVVGELALANVALDAAFHIVRGEAREAHRAGLHQADTSPVRVFLADRSGDN